MGDAFQFSDVTYLLLLSPGCRMTVIGNASFLHGQKEGKQTDICRINRPRLTLKKCEFDNGEILMDGTHLCLSLSLSLPLSPTPVIMGTNTNQLN